MSYKFTLRAEFATERPDLSARGWSSYYVIDTASGQIIGLVEGKSPKRRGALHRRWTPYTVDGVWVPKVIDGARCDSTETSRVAAADHLARHAGLLPAYVPDSTQLPAFMVRAIAARAEREQVSR